MSLFEGNNNDDNWMDEPMPQDNLKEDVVYDAEPITDKVGNLMSTALMNHKTVAQNIKQQILSGAVDPIETYVSLKRMDKVMEATISSQKGDKELKELFKEKVRLSLDGNKSVDMFGANLSLRPTGTTYDFKDCGDQYLNELYKIQEQVKELIKTREEEIKQMLPPDDNKSLGIRSRKTIQEGMPYFGITEDEFEQTIFPATKIQGESIFCIFKEPKH